MMCVYVCVQPVLSGRRDLVIADHAGSGKTLAYLAPLAQKIMEQERALLPSPPPDQPRVLVVTPTAELCAQVRALHSMVALVRFDAMPCSLLSCRH